MEIINKKKNKIKELIISYSIILTYLYQGFDWEKKDWSIDISSR